MSNDKTSPHHSSEPTPSSEPAEQLVTVRSAPSLLAFGITGAVIGFLIAALLTIFSPPVDEYAMQYSKMSVFGVLAVVCMVLGTGLALILALILDRTFARRAQTVRAVATEDE